MISKIARHQNENKDHGLYIRGALADNIPVVRRPDRDSLLEFLRGEKGWVPNLTKDTHRDLNPHLFLEEKAAREYGSRSRSPPRRSTRRDATPLPCLLKLGTVSLITLFISLLSQIHLHFVLYSV